MPIAHDLELATTRLARIHEALLRMLREGSEGFERGLSAGNYSKITGASPATTTLDLSDLVEKTSCSGQGKDVMRATF